MKQYFEVKQKHPDALLLFRVGDFYETFGEDAVKASRILGIVLTSRNNGGSDIELAGFPHHSVELYLPKLVQAGYRVAICEQLEKPSKEKKIVKRDVTEVVTPGVTINESILSSGKNNFVCSMFLEGQNAGLAFLDISTGEFFVHEGKLSASAKILQGFEFSELLYSKPQKEKVFNFFPASDVFKHGMDEWFYESDYTRELLLKHFKIHSLKGFGIEENRLSQIAAGSIIHYLSTIQQSSIDHIHKIVRIESDEFMWLDKFTIRNLELISSNHESGRSLLNIMNKTFTPMGARQMSRWIILPLKGIETIKSRQERVSKLLDNNDLRDEIIYLVKGIGDLERLSAKIPLRRVNPREMIAIRKGLKTIEQIKSILDNEDAFQALASNLNICKELGEKIDQTLDENAPIKLNQGAVIKEGWNNELDEWRSISKNSKDILLKLQQDEAQKTGITSLKIGFNSVFGYYFEVTNKYKDQNLIPEEWVRKQTLKGSERYINDELKKLESKILQAEEQITALEENLYDELVDTAANYVKTLLQNAHVIAELDCYISFAELALENEYCRPVIDDSYSLEIKGGRHPVIEKQLPPEKPYIPNDVSLDIDTQQIILITGPNMSGKSAVLRQTALIALMAHMGSYVPADSARIGIIDKIFTRVGASDNISSGESTFMVEMNETSSILNNLSKRSLIILDEIGRGTSTYDGISIAWAIAEYLHDGPEFHPKTLFATHYHELSELEDNFDRIKNFNVSTKEYDGKVIFLRKLVPGTSAASFGIHVAQMAGMPQEIVDNANSLLQALENKSIDSKDKAKQRLSSVSQSNQVQMQLFDISDKLFLELKNELSQIDIPSMTPIECMLKLKEIQEKFKK